MRLVIAVTFSVLLVFAIPTGAQAFTVETPPWAEEANNRMAKEAAEKHEREVVEAKEREEHERTAKEAQQAKEQTEREQAQRRQQEAERQANEETARKQEAERKAREAATVLCVVPALTGDSLGTARLALRKAHCKLGRVSTPRGRHGVLVVIHQSSARGKRLPQGTAIAIKLAPRKA